MERKVNNMETRSIKLTLEKAKEFVNNFRDLMIQAGDLVC